MTGSSTSAPKNLNETCYCLTLHRALLRRTLLQNSDNAPVFEGLLAARSNLFSDLPVFLPRARISEMQAVVNAICEVVNCAPYRAEVLSQAPAIATVDLGPKGAFMGFDFHITEGSPKLIEVNTRTLAEHF